MSGPEPQVPKSDVSTGSFVSALATASATGLAFYTAFTILRQRYPLVYAPRTFLVPDNILTKPLAGYFSWVSLAWNVDDNDMLRRVGGDSYSALFYMRMLTRLFIVISVPAVVILIPVYATGGAGNPGLNRLGIGNVLESESNRLWATLIMSTIFVMAVLHIIFKLLDKAAWLRHTFLLGPDQHQSLSGYTLLVRDIPKDLRNPEILRDLFNRVQPNKVLDVILIRDVKKIKDMHQEYMTCRTNVEKAAAKYLSAIAKQHAEDAKKGGNSMELGMEEGGRASDRPDQRLLDDLRPTGKAKILFGEKRDTIAHNLKEMTALEGTLERERSEVYSDKDRAESAAFVIFADLYSPHVASLANIHGTPGVMLDKQAVVEPDDVLWDNLDMKLYDRMIRGLIVTVALTALIIFWGAICSFLSSIATLDKIANTASFLNWINNIPNGLKSIIQGLLPTILVKVLFSLLPTILRYFTNFAGAMTKTAQEKSLIVQYYFFLLFNVFLIITVSGGILSTLERIQSDSGGVLKEISKVVPSIATFYINYITLLALTGPAGEMLQLGALIIKPLKLRFLAGTPRAVWQISQPPVFEAGVPFAGHSFIASLGIIYMTAAPLIPLCCVVYFALWQLAYAYKMQYCYATRSQTGGFYLHIAAKQLFIALFIHEIVMVIMFMLKQAWVQLGVVVLVALITLAAYKKANQYTNLMSAIPAKAALDIGRNMNLTMDADVQRELVSNEPWKEEVDAQIAMDNKKERSRSVRAKTSTSALLAGSHANLSEDSLADSNGDRFPPEQQQESSPKKPTHKASADLSVSSTGAVIPRSSSEHPQQPPHRHSSDGASTKTPQPEDPEHPLAAGPDQFEKRFMHPALRPDPPTMWLPNDALGVADEHLRPEIERACKARFVYEDAVMGRDGKIVVPVEVIAREQEP